MARALAVMGALHFIIPDPFDSIVPKYLPGPAHAYTHGSGVAELAPLPCWLMIRPAAPVVCLRLCCLLRCSPRTFRWLWMRVTSPLSVRLLRMVACPCSCR